MGGVGSSRSGVGFRVASREAGSITSNSDGFDIQAIISPKPSPKSVAAKIHENPGDIPDVNFFLS